MKIYLLWKRDMTQWSDVPDQLINIYKNKSDAELEKSKLEINFNKQLSDSDKCIECPVNCESSSLDEIYKYCKDNFDKKPKLDQYNGELYCDEPNMIPDTNDTYNIEERELIE